MDKETFEIYKLALDKWGIEAQIGMLTIRKARKTTHFSRGMNC